MVITFSTEDALALEMFPPIAASKIIPEWYKDLPLHVAECSYKSRYLDGIKTLHSIKGCTPVLDYLTNGYALRLHTDIGFTVEPQPNGEPQLWWYTGAGPECVSVHPHFQCPVEINSQKNTYVKIHLPWAIKLPTGYSCLFYQPEFLFNENIKLFPAIVDCDTYHYQINFPGVLLKTGSFKIDAGTPLVIAMPFRRDEWEAQVVLSKNTQSNPVTRFFERGYRHLFHSKKVFK